MDRYYVYSILSLKTFNLYTGLTNNLTARLQEHNRGIVVNCPIRIPFKLVHYEYFVNLQDAKARVIFLQSNTGKAQLKQSLKKTLQSKSYIPYKLNH